MRGVHERGELAVLVDRVGTLAGLGRVADFFFEELPPWIVCVQVGLKLFARVPPPLLQGVQEVETLVGMVDRLGAHFIRSGREVALFYLVARSPPWGRGARRKICKGFSPGDVSVPGSLLKLSRGTPLE